MRVRVHDASLESECKRHWRLSRFLNWASAYSWRQTGGVISDRVRMRSDAHIHHDAIAAVINHTEQHPQAACVCVCVCGLRDVWSSLTGRSVVMSQTLQGGGDLQLISLDVRWSAAHWSHLHSQESTAPLQKRWSDPLPRLWCGF